MNHNKQTGVMGSVIREGANQYLRNRTGLTDHDIRPTAKTEPRDFENIHKGAVFFRQSVMKTSVLIGAGIMTAGLLSLMTVLISDEFKPQDILELTAFEINAKPDDIPLLTDRTPPKLMDKIDVPPPPPIVDVPITDRPSEPVYVPDNPGGIFDPKPFVVPTTITLHKADTDPTPLVRGAPTMPPRATRSGHCRISFDISPDGKPYNVEASVCSQTLFERSAIRSVQKWVYRPEIQDGLPVTRTGLQTLIRFNLTDDRGGLIPE